MSHLAASKWGVALSLSLSLHHRGFAWTHGEAIPVPSSMSCCPSWLQGDPCGVGTAAIAVLHATCHLDVTHKVPFIMTWWFSLKQKHHFSHGIFSSYLQAELLLAPNICYFLKILICFLFKLPAYLCFSASLEWGCHQELSQHPAGVRAAPVAPWFCRAELGHGVEGWARSLLLFFFNPSSLPNGLFSAPSGFCLTNGVSFLQRYDPGLVVVMVNLAVVIFYFQTELLLLSSVHQC